jgi:hypothetical protein
MPPWLLPLLVQEAPVAFDLIKGWIAADAAKDAAQLAALEARALGLIATMTSDRSATAAAHDERWADSTTRLTPPDASEK